MLATGNPMGCAVHGIVVVPDVTLLQGIANGEVAPPETWRLRRADGREVSIYAMPEEIDR